jgi:hypothetical protein
VPRAVSCSDVVRAVRRQVRVLTRVLPVLLEKRNDAFTDNLFWHNVLPKHSPATATTTKAAAAAGAGDADAATVSGSSVEENKKQETEEAQPDADVPVEGEAISSA